MKSIVVYRPFPTSNHNHCTYLIGAWTVVYRPFPTSNHNYGGLDIYAHGVVYRPFPTSNHNCFLMSLGKRELYIVRFLHQTTTLRYIIMFTRGCISSVSYIKPQQLAYQFEKSDVVYRPFPTSNHNSTCAFDITTELYIVRFLHQTTTQQRHGTYRQQLYIVRFLHQTTTPPSSRPSFNKLYIVRFLHQTTTLMIPLRIHKPLYIVRFLHQTTTRVEVIEDGKWLYIVRFLHQTTTYNI